MLDGPFKEIHAVRFRFIERFLILPTIVGDSVDSSPRRPPRRSRRQSFDPDMALELLRIGNRPERAQIVHVSEDALNPMAILNDEIFWRITIGLLLVLMVCCYVGWRSAVGRPLNRFQLGLLKFIRSPR